MPFRVLFKILCNITSYVELTIMNSKRIFVSSYALLKEKDFPGLFFDLFVKNVIKNYVN